MLVPKRKFVALKSFFTKLDSDLCGKVKNLHKICESYINCGYYIYDVHLYDLKEKKMKIKTKTTNTHAICNMYFALCIDCCWGKIRLIYIQKKTNCIEFLFSFSFTSDYTGKTIALIFIFVYKMLFIEMNLWHSVS